MSDFVDVYHIAHHLLGFSHVVSVRLDDFFTIFISFIAGGCTVVLLSAKGAIGTVRTKELNKYAVMQKPNGEVLIRSPRNFHEGIGVTLILIRRAFGVHFEKPLELFKAKKTRRAFQWVCGFAIIGLLLSMWGAWTVEERTPAELKARLEQLQTKVTYIQDKTGVNLDGITKDIKEIKRITHTNGSNGEGK